MLKCASCGKENESHYKFCLACGAELPAASVLQTPITRGWVDSAPLVVLPQPTPVPEAAAPRPGPLPDPENDPHMVTSRACPTCDNIVPVSFTFCGQCGGRLDTGAMTHRDLGMSFVSEGHLVLVRADGTEGGTHPLTMGNNLIGRNTGPLFNADGYLSPQHAQITLNQNGVQISDLGSLNGVFLRITEEEELFDGDVFRVGQELLRMDLLPPAEPLDNGTHIMGSPPAGAWGRLALIVSREHDGSAFLLSGDAVVLGRERGDILFSEDGYVSGTHARVSMRNGRHYLADLNSSNGTFIKLRGTRQVPAGALLLLGQQLFRVQYR